MLNKGVKLIITIAFVIISITQAVPYIAAEDGLLRPTATADTQTDRDIKDEIKSSPIGDNNIVCLPKVIFLDIDGVLLSMPANRYDVIAKCLSEYGVRISADGIGGMLHGDKQWHRRVLRGDITQQEFIAFINNYLRKFGLKKDFTIEEFFTLYFGSREPNKKLLSFLLKLKQKGIKLGIISNRLIGDSEVIRRKLTSAFLDIFDDGELIFFSCQKHLIKEDVAFFQRVNDVVRRKFGIRPEEILFVEDSEEIIGVAQSASLSTLRYIFYNEAPEPESFEVFRNILAMQTASEIQKQQKIDIAILWAA